MAGSSEENDGHREGEKEAGKTAESPAARRRRIEKMREKQELRALLDDFGDGDLDMDLDLELDDDESEEEHGRWVAASEDDEDVDLDDSDLSDEDDDYVDDEYDDDD